MVTITIDGIETKVLEETTVLEAARDIGIAIPTLCYNPGLSTYGACRVCIVEIVKGNRSSLEASCTLIVSDGLVILTNSERVKKKALDPVEEIGWPIILFHSTLLTSALSPAHAGA